MSQPDHMPPPGQGAGSKVTDSSPTPLTSEQQALITHSGRSSAAPVATPDQAAGSVRGVTAWQSDKRINALWGINQDRNSWVGFTDVGWKKLSNSSESGVVALTMLGALAKQTQTRVDYRDEADGMVHEMYIW